MSVTIQVVGSLRSHFPASSVLEGAATVGDAIQKIGVPQSEGLAMLVNGRLAHWKTPLNDGDVLQLVPQLAGG